MAKQCGFGDHRYELVGSWGELPGGWQLVDACGVTVDDHDRVYVFNRGGHSVIIFNRDGGFFDSWGAGLFTRPHAIALGHDDTIFCVDDEGHCIRKFTLDGKLLRTIGTPDQPSDTGWNGSRDTLRGGPPFNECTNVAIAVDGSLYVSDGYRNCKVHHFTADGKVLHSWGTPGRGPGEFRLPHGICVATDTTVYVGDRDNHRVQRFSPSGEYLGEWPDVRSPCDLTVGKDGRFYVAEAGYLAVDEVATYGIKARVTVRDAAGSILSAWGDEGEPGTPGNFAACHGIAVDSRGDVYVAEVTHAARIVSGQLADDCPVFQKFARV